MVADQAGESSSPRPPHTPQYNSNNVSNNTSSGSGSGSTSTAKKRVRMMSLTPAALLRQKKRRGGLLGNVGPGKRLAAAGRQGSGSGRSGTQTPTKRSTSSEKLTPQAQQRLSEAKRQGSALGTGSETPNETSNTAISVNTNNSNSNNNNNSNTNNSNNDPADAESDEDVDQSEDAEEVSLVKQSKEEVRQMWEQLSEPQQQRYDVYRRTALNKSAVRKLVSSVLNQQISSTLTFVVAGFSKVFVGEIVEKAVEIRDEMGDEGPLKPVHLREAYRRYKKQTGSSASTGFTKRLF